MPGLRRPVVGPAARFAALAMVVVLLAPGVVDAADKRSRAALNKRVDLRPGQQLAAMRAGIAAAPRFFPGSENPCARPVTPLLAFVDGSVMAGNFLDRDGGCYVWLNLAQSGLLNAREICKLALHEMGHLVGLRHSDNRQDVMYAPFSAQPVPRPCAAPLG